ncbi:hypothetical protein BAE44_0011544 [Dichanthelium oligosanthes]|uniref:Uncharacterized protein n=1 Tax=Dichanthelium oligosanthes TaxID=888268 RepID=A0A1E5VQN6_9POAL|nr:hypothetical protein BAE44_0011544 [Dichanthelium oligosanthes]
MSTVNSWIRRALGCQVKTLRVDMGDRLDLNAYLQMSRSPLVSPHLTRLELRCVSMCTHLNFSGCPALEHLEMNYCNFRGMRKMTSPSLKHLIGAYQDWCSCDDPKGFYHVMRDGHISDTDGEEGSDDYA